MVKLVSHTLCVKIQQYITALTYRFKSLIKNAVASTKIEITEL